MAILPSEQANAGRTLLLFFDGTSNMFDDNNTNVAKLFQLVNKDDTEHQLCYYQPGIGTYTSPTIVTPITEAIAQLADEAVAWYISAHILSGYTFLANNWRQGDRVCLFGFSRGAYTARALAGMLEKIGLLPKDNPEQLTMAWDLYKRTDAKSRRLASLFKRTFCRSVLVDFVGVWDTVSSVGAIVSRHFPYAANNDTIRIFRQAISLDEHRAKFRQNRFHVTPPTWEAAAYDPETTYLPDEDVNIDSVFDELSTQNPTDVEEVYFAGAHSGVGGGDYKNRVVDQLSNISLNWMIHKIQEQESVLRVVFDDRALTAFKLGYNGPAVALGTVSSGTSSVNGNTPEKRVNHNVKCKVIDPLFDFRNFRSTVRTLFWWLLELIPFPRAYQDPDTHRWHKSYKPHFFTARTVPRRAKVHQSVKDKIELYGYQPTAKLPNDVVWVSE